MLSYIRDGEVNNLSDLQPSLRSFSEKRVNQPIVLLDSKKLKLKN